MCGCVCRLAGAREASYPGYAVVLSPVWLFFHAHVLDVLLDASACIKCTACLVVFIYLIQALNDSTMCMFPQ